MFRQIGVVFLLLLLAITIPAAAQETATPDRDYLLTVPLSIELSDDPLPLLIALHGYGDTARNFARATGFERLAQTSRFLVAYPQGVLNQWNDGSRGDHSEDDVAYFQIMIEEIAARYPLDRQRVYLVGFSNGGTMVYRAACEAPGIFAGIAAVGGTMRKMQSCEDEAALPVLILHGTGDNVVAYDGSTYHHSVDEAFALWLEINACNSDTITEHVSTHRQYPITFRYATDCPAGNHVLLYSIDGMPHTWPGAYEYSRGQLPAGRFDTASLIWTFFSQAQQAAAPD